MNAYNDSLAWVLNCIEDSDGTHICIKGHEIYCTDENDLNMLRLFLHHSEIRQELTKIRDTLSDFLERTRSPSETTKA